MKIIPNESEFDLISQFIDWCVLWLSLHHCHRCVIDTCNCDASNKCVISLDCDVITAYVILILKVVKTQHYFQLFFLPQAKSRFSILLITGETKIKKSMSPIKTASTVEQIIFSRAKPCLVYVLFLCG